MNLLKPAALLLACSMGFASLALADDRKRGPSDRQGERHAQRDDDRRGDRHDNRRGGRDDDRRADRDADRRGGPDWNNRDLRNDRRYYSDVQPAPRPVYRMPPAPPQRWAHPSDRGQWRVDGRGAGPNRSFYRGNRLPPQYRHRQYVVEDWRGHRLSAPPSGYQWVQTGSDYVLIAVATGIILQILLSQ
jgi:Ni/Co efflux regulator RcnB